MAVDKMPRPTSVDEVRRFLGLVTYYSRFIPAFSSLSYPLRRLLRKDHSFFWSSACESSFLKLKAELCSERVLVPYDPLLPLVLTADAGPCGIAAVLSHDADGVEKPIAYASRSLTDAEMNYSQLDKEALAIVFAVSHFYNYVFGRLFTLVTDNQPLSRIIHHQKALPQMTSARLLRYASFLSGFNYVVRFKKGDENQNVDCLSRAPVKEKFSSADQHFGEEVNQICSQVIFQISSEAITYHNIRAETARDSELATLIESLKNDAEDSQFTLNDGVLFRHDRVVIPASLQQQILDELHDTHLGIVKMKQLARRYVYWSRIDSDIEKLVKGCEQCAATKANPPKAPCHPWDVPDENWDRIHIDYAGPYQGYNFLVCMDAKSKWAEIKAMREAPSSMNTIALLNEIFSVHGFPREMVSDNASIFRSQEFAEYCKANGIFQKFIAAGQPSTNGLAERNVRTLKSRLLAASNDPATMEEKIRRILMRYRATPLGCGKSPAELYLNRKLRIRLDAIFPFKLKPTQPIPERIRSFHAGERVQARVFIDNRRLWRFGVVVRKYGQRHYLVQLDTGRTMKRHIDQLRATGVAKPRKQVTFGPSRSFNVPVLDAGRRSSLPTAESGPQPPGSAPSSQQQAGPGQEAAGPRARRLRMPPSYLRDYILH
ncbi:Hypothetical Protein NTJ_03841 [Nesidiocoris tenuis]|nr:Hypothetical Protein NTJ_03841 [Nesidiocoris tenuis]